MKKAGLRQNKPDQQGSPLELRIQGAACLAQPRVSPIATELPPTAQTCTANVGVTNMMQIDGDEQCADILRLHSAYGQPMGETNFRSDLNNILRLDSASTDCGDINDDAREVVAAAAAEESSGEADIMRIHTSEEGSSNVIWMAANGEAGALAPGSAAVVTTAEVAAACHADILKIRD